MIHQTDFLFVTEEYRLLLRNGTPMKIMTCIDKTSEVLSHGNEDSQHAVESYLEKAENTLPAPAVTETDDGGAVPDGKKWYIAIVHTNCEQKVKGYLEKMDVEGFVPVQAYVRVIGKRKKEMERVVIRSRVFVRCLPDRASRTAVKKVLFVKDFVTYPGTYQDAVIPDRQMEQFKYMLGCNDAQVIVSDNVKMGQRVRVARGYFKGFEGNICELPNKKGTYVGVNMNILGCACVSINLSDLEMLE